MIVILIGLLLSISTLARVTDLISSIIYVQSPTEAITALETGQIIGISLGLLLWVAFSIYAYQNTEIDDLIIPTSMRVVSYVVKLIGLTLTPSLIGLIALTETILVITALTNYLYYVVGGYMA